MGRYDEGSGMEGRGGEGKGGEFACLLACLLA